LTDALVDGGKDGKDKWYRLHIVNLDEYKRVQLEFRFTKEDKQLADSVLSDFIDIENLINRGKIEVKIER
jgi:hypothetical protein